ncbi:unnamed protein product [Spirodela intermedia]|uniref:Uncharacterized protein n=1 Tax=Spirodela intermedia TaxID=51605 RepID=A0A7I8L2S2_SPIIN|nr:unnamed protein product [Spirodela intermedia]
MAFSFPQQQPLLQQSTPNPFQTQTPQQQPQFQFNPQQPQPSPQPQFQFQMQQPQSQFQMQLPQQQPTFLFKSDKSPATYNTKWEELHPDSQKYLLEIETRILEYRNESQRLDQCSRLCDSSIANNGFELDATRIIQELGGISISTDREKNVVQELMASAKEMMRNTEFAVRSFMILHPRFFHPSSTASNAGIGGQATGISPQMASSMGAQDFYSGVPKRPSPFFISTVTQFEKYLAECQLWIEELEQLLHVDNKNAFSSPSFSLESLPSVLSNVYDYFIYTAAKVENLHQYIESMKTAYLADQRRRGDFSDPFLEADRRETAKLEAAAKRVHPTLHLPAIPSQSPTAAVSPFPGSSTPAPSVFPQPGGGSSGSGQSLFSTPSSAVASAAAPVSSLFSTPSSVPTSGLFGPPGFSPQSTPFAPTQTPSLLGPGTPSFMPTPSIGSSPLFSLPSFASGAAVGSGASFGGTSKTSKPKSRTSRR